VNFYLASAIAIPLLVLSIVMESLRPRPSAGEGTRPSAWSASQTVLRIYLAVLMGAGELCALLGLYQNEIHPVLDAVVWAAVGAAIIAAILPALLREGRLGQSWWSRRGGGDFWLPLLVVLGLAMLTVWFIAVFVSAG